MLNGIKEPILDLEKLQEVANKAAEEAAISEVKSFFTSYNSPFRKNIKEWLENNIPNTKFQLPNFIESVQKAIIGEVEKNINIICVKEAVSQIRNGITNLPIDKDGTIKLSNVFEEMSQEVDTEDGKYFEASVKNVKGIYGEWYEVEIKLHSNAKDIYRTFTLHENSFGEHTGTYSVISMPAEDDLHAKADIKTEDGSEIKFPVFTGLANDHILLTIAKLCMFRTPVIVDTKEFYKSNDDD